MKLDNEKLIYLGAGVLLLLIIINSTKSLPLKEVQEQDNTKNFDSASLPIGLKPPLKLADSEPIPKLNVPKKSFNNLSFKPRFDTNDF